MTVCPPTSDPVQYFQQTVIYPVGCEWVDPLDQPDGDGASTPSPVRAEISTATGIFDLAAQWDVSSELTSLPSDARASDPVQYFQQTVIYPVGCEWVDPLDQPDGDGD
jgi:hypothetical protein